MPDSDRIGKTKIFYQRKVMFFETFQKAQIPVGVRLRIIDIPDERDTFAAFFK